MSSPHKPTVMNLANDVKTGSLKDREKALEDLIHLLNRRNRPSTIVGLGDKSYHEIFEAIFIFVLREKPNLYDKRKSQATSNAAASRLSKCASAVRLAVSQGVSKFSRKTLLAVIDHIIQVLPGPNNEFVAPLLQDYIKALAELLSRQAHVELLARKDGELWSLCVEFFIDLIDQVLPSGRHGEQLSETSAVHGAFALGTSRSSTPTLQTTQKRTVRIEGSPLRDALEALHYLVMGANAPILTQRREISGTIVRVLRVKQLRVGSIQTLCFAIFNVIFPTFQTDDLVYANTLVKDVMPLMGFWWRADKVSQDDLIKAVRNEISKSIFFTNLHLEHLAVRALDADICTGIETLSETLWTEYSRRGSAYKLSLTDLTFTTAELPADHFKLPYFGLRPHIAEAESQWAMLQNIARLESISLKCRNNASNLASKNDEQAQKRRKTQATINRVRLQLKSADAQMRYTALQLLPFVLAEGALETQEVLDLHGDLIVLAADKNSNTASWALLACASCLMIPEVRGSHPEILRQLWHLAAKFVSLPTMSRTASVLMHLILDAECLPFHAISEDINSIVTTADVNGPSILCDSSLALMLHLLHLRNARLPGASQTTCGHIIRWAFLRWNPNDPVYASSQASHISPAAFVNVLRACCGVNSLPTNSLDDVPGGSLSEAWKLQRNTSDFLRYLLLLQKGSDMSLPVCAYTSDSSSSLTAPDANNVYASRKLILELLHPKLEELDQLRLTWTKTAGQGGTQVSAERLQSILTACIIGAMLLPQIRDLNTSQSSSIYSFVMNLGDDAILIALNSADPGPLVKAALRIIRQCIPRIRHRNLQQFSTDTPELLRLLAKISDSLYASESGGVTAETSDFMDLDDFDSQASGVSTGPVQAAIPRLNIQMSLSSGSFDVVTKKLLGLMSAFNEDPLQIGLLPDTYVKELLASSDEDLLSCRDFLVDLVRSDVVISPESALVLVQRLGSIVSQSDYQCCEVALTTCIEVIENLCSIWLADTGQLVERVGDLYNHFIKVCLRSNIFSPNTQMSLSSLLFTLMKADNDYASSLGLDSSRTSLLYILTTGSMRVKNFISTRIADIFELYVLKTHDDIFVDVLESLPTDPDNMAGIAFRLLLLAKLACRWSTLLRRCTYHIFEIPGRIPQSAEYATRCFEVVSQSLELSSSQDLFRLFSRQILYTWLEHDAFEDIPFAIFGFSNLSHLLRSTQSEAAGLTTMRGQTDASAQLSQLIGCSEVDMLRRNFTTALAYSMLYGDSWGGEDKGRGEMHIKNVLGDSQYQECLYTNFVDIVASFFNLIDQDDEIERSFNKQPNFQYAGTVMKTIKEFAYSTASLPANQQPMFRAKFLIRGLQRLCFRTEYSLSSLWSPVFVVSTARKILDTVHPALGSLHACSVLRKVRILMCMAGSAVHEPYCCEMLLNSIRSFIVDSECADDALGMTQYLLSESASSLRLLPTFMAGYSLSTLASLRVFLESSQSSTTQEHQFKATMDKAQKFHRWFSTYLDSYDSDQFSSDMQRQAFKFITSSAAHIRSTGNAEQGTSESKLLLQILADDTSEAKLLNEPSRQLALELLCENFSVPEDTMDDVIETDLDAIRYASVIWKSCETRRLDSNYLTWAGRVVGRAFLGSGEIPQDILRETSIDEFVNAVAEPNSSEMGLVALLKGLTSSTKSVNAGIGEAALRTVVSEAISQGNQPLISACQRSLSESLFHASQWGSYRSPPSETQVSGFSERLDSLWEEEISSPSWLSRLSIYLARAVPDSIMLSALPRVLISIPGFSKKAFPFILHLVLLFQVDQDQVTKRHMSRSLPGWFSSTTPEAKENQKLLINSIIYLRTKEYPKETSIVDRIHWLDVDYKLAMEAASRCGMFKTALFFAELTSGSTRSSRRSSAAQETDIHDSLLKIFENIDDPDAYYGLPEDASLANVLARVEYEKDGSKSLAFRGSQYDSHIKLRNPSSQADAQALVKALSTLGFSGLSHALLRAQQDVDDSAASLESTYSTARRLEIWNLPAPTANNHHAVVVYKTYQSMHQGTSFSVIRDALYDGFNRTMRTLAHDGNSIMDIRSKLAALASLSEVNDALTLKDSGGLEEMMQKFKTRTPWMRSGLYNDVSQILSCRGTTMSLLSQHSALANGSRISSAVLRQSQIQSMIMAGEIYRYHQATQESLNSATALTDLISPCRELGIQVDAAINIESANSLWDQGEMEASIRLLQRVERDTSLNKQSIPISRSDLLAQIARKVSLARLESPRDIQKRYLEPALKELKGCSKGREAGLVFHQFAVFCDDQLQDPDGLEDLARLQSLREGKRAEVEELKALISSTRDSQTKSRYSHVLSKEKQWLYLDEQDLRRVEQTRAEFVRLSVENFLLSLIASDEHDNDALRFTALWLERSEEELTNKAVMRHLRHVPTRKFANLMNQLTSRLQSLNTTFQKMLMELVYNICVDHPYHGMYQIWSGTKVKAQRTDEIAILRVKATETVAQWLLGTESVARIWQAVERTSKQYHYLAMERASGKYKSGAKIALKESQAGQNLIACLARYHIPPPTIHIEVSPSKDYTTVPTTINLDPNMLIASGISAPKIITVLASNGQRFKQLVKGGHDDLRQDAIMEQVFSAVSALLKLHRATQQRNLGIRTYKVLPLTATSGIIEFVPNTIPLHEFLMPAHERYHPRDMKGGQCRKEIFSAQNRSVEQRIAKYRWVTERFHPVMKYFFMEYFVNPDDWFVRRQAYTRSTAAISILGHVLGLGDRHGHNILLDTKTGEVVHIDLGVAFEAGRILPVPELVPFRLTRDTVDGMGITKTEGVFRRCCEFTLDALREEQYSIMTILDVLRYDPLYTWSISPLRLAKLQKARQNDEGPLEDTNQRESDAKRGKTSHLNEPSEADRALEVVRKKLTKTLSVTATVNELINQATDERNLAVLYSGWAAYA